VQVLSALGGVTVADNGTVTPTGTANLAFPASGIGGSLPLSLPTSAPAQSAQLTFPQGTIDQATQDLMQEQPPPSAEAPPTGPPVPSNFLAPGANNDSPALNGAQAANTFDANGSPIANDAGPQLAQNQAATPSISSNSLTVILPDGTPQTFPLGSSTNPTAPPTFGPGSQIQVPVGTQVPLPGGGSTIMDGAGTLTFPNSDLPAIRSFPAIPSSDNSAPGSTAVAMNNAAPQPGTPAGTDTAGTGAGTSVAGGGVNGAPPPADAAAPAPAPVDAAPAPAASVPEPGMTISDPTTPAPPSAPAPYYVASGYGSGSS